MKTRWIVLGLSLLFTVAAQASLKVPFVFSDHMVLQQGIPVRVWGEATPGAKVEVAFASQRKSIAADASGKWMLSLDPLDASKESRDLTVSSGEEKVEIKDVLVGEVWVCSGQSNMEKPVGEQKGQRPTANAKEEIATADFPQIRLLQVAKSTDPESVAKSRWAVCTPANLDELHFSAVGYFFARELHRDLDLPVGMIHTSWGGTRIEPWTPTEAFDQFESLKSFAETARKRGPTTRNANQAPSGLWNVKVAPFVPFGIRGALWYQGESNVMIRDRGLYAEKMQALVGGWRTAWGQGDFPFYFVQLAPYAYARRPNENLNEYELPAVWEAQLKSLRAIPNTGMVVTTDLVDNVRDIHPIQKKEVGERLALWALSDSYKKQGIVRSGPLYRSAEFKDGRVILRFDEIGSGLAIRNGEKLTHFMIAGDDQKFVPAEARIEGDTVVVGSADVSAPKAVRFAWSEDAMPNLTNREGLPASPFRTDEWELPSSAPRDPATPPGR